MINIYSNAYNIYGDFTELSIVNIKKKQEVASCVFSTKHLNRIKAFRWLVWEKKNKWGKTYYYIANKIKNNKKTTTKYLHHVIIGKPEGFNVVDHINRNTFDNRDENLRFATRSQNVLNNDK